MSWLTETSGSIWPGLCWQMKWSLASDWSRGITWPIYWFFIGQGVMLTEDIETEYLCVVIISWNFSLWFRELKKCNVFLQLWSWSLFLMIPIIIHAEVIRPRIKILRSSSWGHHIEVIIITMIISSSFSCHP